MINSERSDNNFEKISDIINSGNVLPDTDSLSDTSFYPSRDLDDSNINDDDYFISKPVNSSFELNLAEFPIAFYSGKLPSGVSNTFYQYTDTIRGRNGEPVERKWTIEAHATEMVKDEKGKDVSVELGFGGPATLDVFYELFQIWKEQGFKEPKIYIGTYYHFLNRLGWGNGKAQYKQLKRTLRCIHGLHITGQRCFYIPELDDYLKIDMYPFPSMGTFSKDGDDNSNEDYIYINVAEEFFNAIKKKSVFYIPFDRHYFRKLKPMEKKLALMLSKIFTPYRKAQRFEWTRNIYQISKQIPILTDKGYMIRRQLKRICDGLIKNEFPFLSDYVIKGDNITFYNNMQTSLNLVPDDQKSKKKVYETVEWLVKEQLKVCGDEHSRKFYTLVAKYVPDEIILQCLSEARQEGKHKEKLYTKRVLELGKEYLKPYLRKSDDNEPIIKDFVEKNIDIELDKDQEAFITKLANIEINSDKPEIDYEYNEMLNEFKDLPDSKKMEIYEQCQKDSKGFKMLSDEMKLVTAVFYYSNNKEK